MRSSLLVREIAGALALLAVSAAPSQAEPRANLPWDWTGILGTGQSLSVGAQAPVVLSTAQPYHNLKLWTDHLPWPIDPDDRRLALVPLVEPVGRRAPTYPSSWPENIDGETPHSAMGNEITALVRGAFGRDFVSVHAAVGESGQGMVFLRKNAVPKGVNGRSYKAGLIAIRAMARLARAEGRSFGVGALVVTHGESDAGNAHYEAELLQLWRDYEADLSAITGQRRPILMIVSQQNSCNDRSPSTLAQWRIGADFPADAVCSGPKYQYPSAEGVHLTADGYRLLGEKYGQVYFERAILGDGWRPLEPVALERKGAVLTVRFHVPVQPLVWETRFEEPHPSVPEWRQGKGFEVTAADGKRVGIASAAIAGDAVVLTCASDPGPGARVGYAMVGEKERMSKPFAGTYRWGLLRDSDPFRGSVTGTAQPNYAVAFELTAP